MKKYSMVIFILIILTAVSLSGCGGGGIKPPSNSVYIEESLVPGVASFPTGEDDSGSCSTVNYPYYIAQTEVTYQLWYTVYTWATTGSGAIGAGQYSFENPGKEGSSDWEVLDSRPPTDEKNQHPVTNINWRDAMVWCNALTEYYNAHNKTSLDCVYVNGGILRDSRNSNASACDNVTVVSTAKGFRLPTSMEWELAARWRTDSTNAVDGYTNPWFTKGFSASGATADLNNEDATKAVAWYSENSGDSTRIVGTAGSPTPTIQKTGNANALGLYDMSGNVWEWTFDRRSEGYRILRGGGYNVSASGQMIGRADAGAPIDFAVDDIGFRPARTQ